MEQPVYVHKAQAMCYAYIYAKQNRLERIGVQMTYCNLDTEEIRYFREIYTFETLTVWFGHLIEDYRKWADWQIAWKKQRQEACQKKLQQVTGRIWSLQEDMWFMAKGKCW